MVALYTSHPLEFAFMHGDSGNGGGSDGGSDDE